MNRKTFMKAAAADPRCVKCGDLLTDKEIIDCLIAKIVPACQECASECKEQMHDGAAMWPSGWFGHVYTISCGEWRVEDEDGGVYDWPITR